MITVQEAIESLSVSIVEDTNGIVFVGNFSGGVENTDIIELLTHLSTENEQLKARLEKAIVPKLVKGDIRLIYHHEKVQSFHVHSFMFCNGIVYYSGFLKSGFFVSAVEESDLFESEAEALQSIKLKNLEEMTATNQEMGLYNFKKGEDE